MGLASTLLVYIDKLNLTLLSSGSTQIQESGRNDLKRLSKFNMLDIL